MTLDSQALSLFAAVLIGWLGGVHCLGMCGGIVSALTLSVPPSKRPILLLAYNLGRCTTYALLGAVAGAMGYAGIATLGIAPWALLALANALLIGMGLYLMGWPWLVRPLEQGGQHLWRHIEPYTRRLLPISTPTRAVLVGLLWGFLPCGLVYSALVTALATGNSLAVLFRPNQACHHHAPASLRLQMRDRHSAKVLGEIVSYRLRPGWVDRALMQVLGSPQLPMCVGPHRGLPSDFPFLEDALIAATLRPPGFPPPDLPLPPRVLMPNGQ